MDIRTRAKLYWHLTGNLYPPQAGALEACVEALDLANAGGDLTTVIGDLPDGTKVTAAMLIEDLHLEAFIDQNMLEVYS